MNKQPSLRGISFLLVVAFTVTTVLPPSFAQELQLTTKISPTSRFEITTPRVSLSGTSLAVRSMLTRAAILLFVILPMSLTAITTLSGCPRNRQAQNSPQQQPQNKPSQETPVQKAQKLIAIMEKGGLKLEDRIEIIRALGELRDPTAIPILVKMLTWGNKHRTGEPAMAALIKIGNLSLPALQKLLEENKNPDIQQVVRWILKIIDEFPKLINDNIAIAKDKSKTPSEREMAMSILGEFNEVIALIDIYLDPTEADNMRQTAVWMLAKVRDPRALPYLKKLFLDERNLNRKETALLAISRIGDPALPALREIVFDSTKDLAYRIDIVIKLGNTKNPSLIPLLIEILTKETEPFKLREAAAKGLSKMDEATSALAEVLSSTKDDLARLVAVKAIAYLKDQTPALPALTGALENSAPTVKMYVIVALGRAKVESLIPQLSKIALDSSAPRAVFTTEVETDAEARQVIVPFQLQVAIQRTPQDRYTVTTECSLRLAAIEALGNIGARNEAAISALIKLSSNEVHSAAFYENRQIRQMAMESLGAIGDAATLSALEDIAKNDPDEFLREVAKGAIFKIKEHMLRTGQRQPKESSMAPANTNAKFSLTPLKLMPIALLSILLFPQTAYGYGYAYIGDYFIPDWATFIMFLFGVAYIGGTIGFIGYKLYGFFKSTKARTDVIEISGIKLDESYLKESTKKISRLRASGTKKEKVKKEEPVNNDTDPFGNDPVKNMITKLLAVVLVGALPAFLAYNFGYQTFWLGDTHFGMWFPRTEIGSISNMISRTILGFPLGILVPSALILFVSVYTVTKILEKFERWRIKNYMAIMPKVDSKTEEGLQRLTRFVYKNRYNGNCDVSLLLSMLKTQQPIATGEIRSLMIALVGMLASRVNAKKKSFSTAHDEVAWPAHFEFNLSGLKDKLDKTEEEKRILRHSAFTLLAIELIPSHKPKDTAALQQYIPYLVEIVSDKEEIMEIRLTAAYLLGRLADTFSLPGRSTFELFKDAVRPLHELSEQSNKPFECGYALREISVLYKNAPTTATRHEGAATFQAKPLKTPALVPAGVAPRPVTIRPSQESRTGA